MKRRTFVRIMGGAAGAAVSNGSWPIQSGRRHHAARGRPSAAVLGRTKQEVSIVVFPGLALSREDRQQQRRGQAGLRAGGELFRRRARVRPER